MTLPTLPLVDPNQLADAGNLSALKQAAARNSPDALRAAARQFESLFTSMMLKSMREASFKDPLFGSDQGNLYQDMYDDQIAAVMSRGKGLGLADMLVQQLRREGMGAAQGTSQSATATSRAGSAAATPSGIGIEGGSSPTSGTRPSTAASVPSGVMDSPTVGSPAGSCPTTAQQAAFAQALWPDARQAARQLGVSPVTLLAQAALETDWGRSMPQGAGGASSNNLFGIKASSGWNGPAVSSSTQEYGGGAATTVTAQFRSYDSTGQCFQDYVDLLKGNPRYTAALGTGNDVHAFGTALQQGGYATDPAYASKLSAVAGTLTRALTGASGGALKFAASRPTTSGSGTL
jgi:flagellar protein FlgJ